MASHTGDPWTTCTTNRLAVNSRGSHDLLGSVICYSGSRKYLSGYSFVMNDTNREGHPNEVAHRMVSGRVPSFLSLPHGTRGHPRGATVCTAQPGSSTELPRAESSLESPPHRGAGTAAYTTGNGPQGSCLTFLPLNPSFSSWTKAPYPTLPITLQRPAHTWPATVLTVASRAVLGIPVQQSLPPQFQRFLN